MQASNEMTHTNSALARGRLMSIPDGREKVIYVWRGLVWVTQQGDERDVLLGPGEWFQLDREGTAIVQALERSSLTLTAFRDEPPAGVLQRFWNSLFAPMPRRALPVL
jgi:hypothetical protein